MIKSLISSTLLALFFYTAILAQTIPNGNFESWEEINETLEPTYWTTSNFPDNENLPVSAHQTENACDGNYSLKLTSTAPSLEGPGPGYAQQEVVLGEPATSATLTFMYAADILEDGATGEIHIRTWDTSGDDPVPVANQMLEITELTKGCQNGSLSIASTVPFHRIDIELRAEPFETGFSTEGLSEIRFDNLQLDVALAVKENDLSNQLTILPNPTKNNITLQHNDLRIKSIQLMDASGRIIKDFPPLQNQINLEEFSSATYLLKITAKEGTLVKKVVKE